jgi:hypothetical protein
MQEGDRRLPDADCKPILRQISKDRSQKIKLKQESQRNNQGTSEDEAQTGISAQQPGNTVGLLT